jgi:hypothetical protein
MAKYFVRMSCVIAAAVTMVVWLSGCDLIPGFGNQPTSVPPAVEMLPDLPGYTVTEGQTLTDYISKLSGGAALLAGQPELTAAVAAIDGIVGCYQKVGAVRARIYSDQSNPLSAGTVAIADRGALLDPMNLFRCVALKKGPQTQAITIQPCTANYTLTKDGNEFYILYAGTTLEICQAFCANLEGCTAHKP